MGCAPSKQKVGPGSGGDADAFIAMNIGHSGASTPKQRGRLEAVLAGNGDEDYEEYLETKSDDDFAVIEVSFSSSS